MMNYYNQNQAGTNYAPQRVAKMTQPLTPEMIAQLKKNAPNFTIDVNPEDMFRSYCTHKDPNTGQFTLVDNNNPHTHGSKMCTLCNKTFDLVELDQEVQMIMNKAIDILQTIKTYYVDIPETVVTELFPIIPLLEKIPKLANMAANNFKAYETGTVTPVNNPYGMNAYSALLNSGYNPYNNPTQQQMMMGQQPMYGQPQGAPQGQQQFGQMGAEFNPFYAQGQPQFGGYNVEHMNPQNTGMGFDPYNQQQQQSIYGQQPQFGQQPQAQNFAYGQQPQQPVQQHPNANYGATNNQQVTPAPGEYTPQNAKQDNIVTTVTLEA